MLHRCAWASLPTLPATCCSAWLSPSQQLAPSTRNPNHQVTTQTPRAVEQAPIPEQPAAEVSAAPAIVVPPAASGVAAVALPAVPAEVVPEDPAAPEDWAAAREATKTAVPMLRMRISTHPTMRKTETFSWMLRRMSRTKHPMRRRTPRVDWTPSQTERRVVRIVLSLAT